MQVMKILYFAVWAWNKCKFEKLARLRSLFNECTSSDRSEYMDTRGTQNRIKGHADPGSVCMCVCALQTFI